MTDFLYQGLVDWFQKELTEGRLSPGDRMPSLRKLSKEQGISLNTAIHGYELLRKDGWIESRPKSGYFVCHHSELRPALMLASDQGVSLAEKHLMSKHQRDYNRSALLCHFDQVLEGTPFNFAQKPFLLSSVKDESSTQGALSVRRALSKYFNERSIQANVDKIWLHSSAMMFYVQTIQVHTKVGDRVLVITPCDYRLTQALLDLGRKPIALATGDHGVDLEVARQCIDEHQCSLVVLPSQFSLPFGGHISNLSLRRWVALLDEKELSAIEWDMASHLGYRSQPPMLYKSLDTHQRVTYIGGFEVLSQARGGISWCLPSQPALALESAFFAMDGRLQPDVEQAITHYFEQNGEKKMASIARSIWALSEQLKAILEQKLGNGLSIIQSKGGYYLWLQIDVSLQPLMVDRFWEAYQSSGRQALIQGEYFGFSDDAKTWIGLNITHSDVDASIDWLMNALVIEEPDEVKVVQESSDEEPKVDIVEEKVPTESDKPLYNPMLDLINHDFG